MDSREACTAPWEEMFCADFRRVAVLTSCLCSPGHFHSGTLCVHHLLLITAQSPPCGALPLSLSLTSPFPEKVKENKYPEHLGSSLCGCCFGRRCFSCSPPGGSAPQPDAPAVGVVTVWGRGCHSVPPGPEPCPDISGHYGMCQAAGLTVFPSRAHTAPTSPTTYIYIHTIRTDTLHADCTHCPPHTCTHTWHTQHIHSYTHTTHAPTHPHAHPPHTYHTHPHAPDTLVRKPFSERN